MLKLKQKILTKPYGNFLTLCSDLTKKKVLKRIKQNRKTHLETVLQNAHSFLKIKYAGGGGI